MPFLLLLAASCFSCCSPSVPQCVSALLKRVSVVALLLMCSTYNLQVTCLVYLLLFDVLWFHFSHPFHSCGLCCLLSFLPSR